jgi:hypothetical protein
MRKNEIERIKKLMLIESEDKQTNDTPIDDLRKLSVLLEFIFTEEPDAYKIFQNQHDLYYDGAAGDIISDYGQMAALGRNISADIICFIIQTIKDNWSLIKKKDFDVTKYQLPKQKEFIIEGRIIEVVKRQRYFRDSRTGYSEEEILHDYSNFEYHLYDGDEIGEEYISTEEMEQKIDSIVEKKKLKY